MLTLDLMLRATGARRLGPAAAPETLTGVCIDSRLCAPGMLFACLPGEQADGHDFAAVAVEKGAAAILAARDPFGGQTPPVPLLLVQDPATALRALGAVWRDAFAARGGLLIALTGTAGKTSLKEMLAHVLEQHGPVSRTPGNLNNSLGVPLSLLNARQEDWCWVMEAGISHAGDMDELGALLRPDLALILNVGPGHSAGLGARGTAYHKAQLLRYVRQGGTALINADYPDLVREARAVRPELRFFGCETPGAEVRAAYVRPLENGRGIYRLWLDGTVLEVETPFQGAFAAENVAAAAAAALCLGLPATAIAAGLRDAPQPPQRFRRVQAGPWLVIDDSYNANPLSMTRMLRAAAEAGQPLYCMLGAMGELGDIAPEEHRKLGQMLATVNPAAVFWTGPYFAELQQGLEHGAWTGAAREVQNPADMLAALRGRRPGTLLVKGSRVNRLERFVKAVLEQTRISHAV